MVLRTLGERLAIFVNSSSPKWAELNANGHTQLLVYLASLSVQYRLDAKVEAIPKQFVDESWQLRPDIPKGMDWFYTQVQTQSSAIENREILKEQYTEHTQNPPATEAPDTACGLYLNIFRIERLELLPTDIHSRSAWLLNADHWQMQTLVP